MIHTVKNDKLAVEIDEYGAELQSVRTADGAEYLWQGGPAYWTGRAPNLFPIVGRLTDGGYTYKGKTYFMGTHGFARKSAFWLVSKTVSRDKTKTAIVFELSDNDETQKEYPFEFVYRVTYVLDGNSLETVYEVLNAGRGELIFALGGHPGFNVPSGGGNFEDFYLEFSDVKTPREIVLSPACFITGETRPFELRGGKILDLKHGLFDNDAIVLIDAAKSVTLKSDKSARSVTVSYPGMKYLGLWHKPHSDAPYVCIEPWTSLPSYDKAADDLETKRDMIRLAPGKTYANGFTVIIR
ncbi:MAG: aldose 1-epimerase family protein [Clostridiales bacterium]|jgi:galactose mutarotase-like enzyme|nr:aldose 1-epimerase family protein [Clostridiales bacterium]